MVLTEGWAFRWQAVTGLKKPILSERVQEGVMRKLQNSSQMMHPCAAAVKESDGICFWSSCHTTHNAFEQIRHGIIDTVPAAIHLLMNEAHMLVQQVCK